MKTATELNSLSDAELSEVFAVEVAGLTNIQHWEFKDIKVTCKRIGDDMIYTLPSFATSADAVMPWLTKWAWSASGDSTDVIIEIHHLGRHLRDTSNFVARGNFPRAACISLILANRQSNKSAP